MSTSGIYTLLSPSGLATTVRVDAARALPASRRPACKCQIALTPSYRSCHRVNVQNVRLVSTQALPNGGPGKHVGAGWNIINVYMGQALDGIPTAPTVYRFDTLPFQFIPPDQKSPSGPFVTLQQDDLSTLITN